MKAAILGGSGYVGGELIRLLTHHPQLDLVAVASRHLQDQPVRETFPHLTSSTTRTFCAPEDVAEEAREEPMVLFAALPHQESASQVDTWLKSAHPESCVMDLSADFRFQSPDRYREIYGQDHGAPHLLSSFTCFPPDLAPSFSSSEAFRHRAHPGCFTTAVTLGIAPLHAAGLSEGSRYAVTGITGSTGSGKTPSRTTHHPERRSNLRAYKPLNHRHRPEMEDILGRSTQKTAEVGFVPHSGPFSRGIHATIHGRLNRRLSRADIQTLFREYYQHSEFVTIGETPPSLTSVVGTNHCEIGVEVQGQEFVVFSVIDNLIKGAAGGAIQSMNLALGFTESAGLESAGLGWL